MGEMKFSYMFVVPNLSNMKKLLRSTVMLAVMSCLLFFSCTPAQESEATCNCEEATYMEEKYQEETDNSWQLNRIETNRVGIDCQDETDFVRTGNGTEVKRIECN